MKIFYTFQINISFNWDFLKLSKKKKYFTLIFEHGVEFIHFCRDKITEEELKEIRIHLFRNKGLY